MPEATSRRDHIAMRTVISILNRGARLELLIGTLNAEQVLRVTDGDREVFRDGCVGLHRAWFETTYHLQKLRDNPECAQQEYDRVLDTADPGLSPRVSFDPAQDVAAPFIIGGTRPRMAILREQGVNGQVEMAAAFDRAGFSAVDVHMSGIIAGRVNLKDFKGFAARHYRAHHSGRAVHHPDAASGARVSHRAEFLASRGVGRGRALAQDVPQRAPLDRLTPR